MSHFTQQMSFEMRAEEARRILSKYPNRVPVIIERAPRSDLPEIDKKKFLVPGTMLCGEFRYIIHKHITQSAAAQNSYGHQQALTADQTIYLFVKNSSPKTGALMSEIYETLKDEDGFLYMTYAAENTLGCDWIKLDELTLD
jgi:GABA(A) receptor-associated protein